MKNINFKELNASIHLGFLYISNSNDFGNCSQTTFQTYFPGFLPPLCHLNIPTYPVPKMSLYIPFLTPPVHKS